ncbi:MULTISPECIES: GAF and ANTAR domain-containing protein [Streptacidiphilus]|uniref:GAF and ANTAR domain-containing protein n=1 Tax=Streptacidiphilus cavernicola TaxID=3342716 RepID=A0ABV6UKU7_9ACTN|nr:GAF and ANTAR domain-containing protein [Streptacidiphilus jeojiense]
MSRPPQSGVPAAVLWSRTARALHAPGSVAGTLEAVAALAHSIVPGADFAGVTVLERDGALQGRAATAPVVQELDRLQGELGEGPCLEAARETTVLRIQDMDSERRWPGFASHAKGLGIVSMISCTLAISRGPRASLNLHAARRGAFDDEAAQLAAVYADQAGLALSRALAVESLHRSMEGRQVIGEATGILMERHRSGSEAAFAELVGASQRLNVKLREIALQVVRTGQEPGDLELRDFPDRPRQA